MYKGAIRRAFNVAHYIKQRRYGKKIKKKDLYYLLDHPEVIVEYKRKQDLITESNKQYLEGLKNEYKLSYRQ